MFIRRGQMDGLSSYMRKNFEDRVVEHLNKLLPQKTASMGESAVRSQIQEGITRAQNNYYVKNEDDVARYIDLQFMLGPEFEEKPEMKWARQILVDGALTGEQKMRRIYDKMPGKLVELGAGRQPAGGRGQR